MKNCGTQYHIMVVVKDVLGEMMKLVLNRRCEGSVRRKTLELLEEWAAQLRIPQYREVYESLQSKGVEFPGTASGSDGGGRVPMHTPRMTVPRSAGDLSGLGDIDEADLVAIRAALAEAEAEVAAEEEQERAAATSASASCLLYTSPSPRDATLSRMPSSA